MAARQAAQSLLLPPLLTAFSACAAHLGTGHAAQQLVCQSVLRTSGLWLKCVRRARHRSVPWNARLPSAEL